MQQAMEPTESRKPSVRYIDFHWFAQQQVLSV